MIYKILSVMQVACIFSLFNLLRFIHATDVPLFNFEHEKLNDQTLRQLYSDDVTASIAHLFDFAQSERESRYNESKCKTFPGDANWPTARTWAALNSLLNNSLIPTIPIAAPCYDTRWGAKNLTQCNNIIDSFTQSGTHEGDPTSIMWPIFQGRTCMPRNDTTSNDTCTLGGYPDYAINISSVAQIQLAVNFARNTNIRLVVKNTGHDYLGKSAGAGSLAVWMHNLKDIDYLPEYQVGDWSGAAFKIGAGVTIEEIYRAAEDRNQTVTGGICRSVGYVGGYLQGGGHTPLNGLYGMGADSVLAYQVVLSSGQFVMASETSYADLFWALRGGGPGTFGIVVSTIVKAHPNIDVTLSTFTLGNTTDGKQLVSRENFWRAVRKYWELFPTYTDANLYSFFFVNDVDGQLTLNMLALLAPGHTVESFNNVTASWMKDIESLGVPFQSPKNTTHYSTYFPAYWDAWGTAPFPLGIATSLPGNRLIPRSHWEDEAKLNKTFEILKAHVEAGRHFGCYHQHPANPQDVDNAVSSAWRHAQAFIITASPTFDSNATAAEIKAANDNLNRVILQPWRDITPAKEFGGSYLNEAAVDEPNWKEDFYGTQYDRLLRMKKKYDPDWLFYVTTGAGSDEWVVQDGEQGVTTQDGRLCRVV